MHTDPGNERSEFNTLTSVAAPNTYQAQPYGLVHQGLLSPRNCPADKNCFINVTGACQCEANSPFYLPQMRNVYM